MTLVNFWRVLKATGFCGEPPDELEMDTGDVSTRLNYNLHLRKYLVVQGSWVRVKPSNARSASGPAFIRRPRTHGSSAGDYGTTPNMWSTFTFMCLGGAFRQAALERAGSVSAGASPRQAAVSAPRRPAAVERAGGGPVRSSALARGVFRQSAAVERTVGDKAEAGRRRHRRELGRGGSRHSGSAVIESVVHRQRPTEAPVETETARPTAAA